MLAAGSSGASCLAGGGVKRAVATRGCAAGAKCPIQMECCTDLGSVAFSVAALPQHCDPLLCCPG